MPYTAFFPHLFKIEEHISFIIVNNLLFSFLKSTFPFLYNSGESTLEQSFLQPDAISAVNTYLFQSRIIISRSIEKPNSSEMFMENWKRITLYEWDLCFQRSQDIKISQCTFVVDHKQVILLPNAKIYTQRRKHRWGNIKQTNRKTWTEIPVDKNWY